MKVTVDTRAKTGASQLDLARRTGGERRSGADSPRDAPRGGRPLHRRRDHHPWSQRVISPARRASRCSSIPTRASQARSACSSWVSAPPTPSTPRSCGRQPGSAVSRAHGGEGGPGRDRGAPGRRSVSDPAGAQPLAEGSVLAGYRFDAYRERGRRFGHRPVGHPASCPADTISERPARPLAGASASPNPRTWRATSPTSPPNDLSPAALAAESRRVGREVGLRVKVLGVSELEKRKMGAILAVERRQLPPAAAHHPRAPTQGKRPRTRARSAWWARASPSTPGASRSSPLRAWTR